MKAVKFIPLAILLLYAWTMYAGTTGKIAGTVTDARTGEKLLGANVVVEGLATGASTNTDGYFVILNIPPGRYRVKASMVGYTPVSQVDVRVDIDQTTGLDFKLSQETVEGEEVVVVAQRPVVQRDVAASRTNLTIEDVTKLPVVSVSAAVGLQAGIQGGLVVRGSTSDQVAFMINGQTLRDERDNTPYTRIALSAVQDIQIQTGGFNAEYGNLRSGVVNVVTREGGKASYNFGMNARYAPNRPKHFGASIYDRNSYWVRPYVDDAVAWTGTKNGAWNAFQQNQYPEFEGWNAISQKSLKDTDPTNDLSPAAAQQLWLWEHRRIAENALSDYDIDAGFGGPIPGGEALGNLRFYAAYRQSRNAYLIPLSDDAFRDFNGQLRFTSDITPTFKLQLEGLYGRTTGTNDNNTGLAGTFSSSDGIADALHQVSFIDSRIFATDYWAPTRTDYVMVGVKASHMLSRETFYDASVFMFRSKYDTNPGRLRNPAQVYRFGNSYYVDEAPFGFQPAPSTGITGLRMGVGMSNSRDSSVVATYTAKFDITSQLDRFNQIKSGVELVYTDNNVNYASVDIFLPSGRSRSNWHTFPKRGGFYLQDKLEFEGMIANLGVRLDYLDPGGEWYTYDPYNPAFSAVNSLGLDTLLAKQKTDKQLMVSPRLGVAFPITEDAKLFFNYGHMRSLPTPENLFLIRRFSDNNAVTRLANPNNRVPKTIAYELGYEQNLADLLLIRVAGYYKDITLEPRLVTYTNRDNTVNYSVYAPNTYGDTRGFELTVDKNRGDWVRGFINYTYDVRSSGYFGYAQYYENPTRQRDYQRTNIYQTKPIPRPYARANIDFFTPLELGPAVGGFSLLGDWRVNFVASWSSGFYFTWVGGGSIAGIENNIQWRDSYNIDMRLSKGFQLSKLNLEFYVDITNLLNTKYMTQYGFVDTKDYEAYLKSLHLPAFAPDIAAQIGYVNIPGNDRPGDYRTVPYEPYDPNDPDPAHKQYVLDNKTYIDMPNQETFTFLNPRRWFFGVRMSFDL